MKLLLFLCAYICAVEALVDVAKDRPYTVSPEGFTELVFRSHNSQGYVHTPIYGGSFGQLTLGLPTSAAMSSPMWTNVTDFNVTVIITMESPAVIKEAMITGPCCNLGIFTPIAGYVYGSNSIFGPWTRLATSQGLEAGDTIETPAVKYEMHMVADQSITDSWAYIKVIVTGAADKYISIYRIMVYA